MNSVFFDCIPAGTLLFKHFLVKECLSASDNGAIYLCQSVNSSAELVVLKLLALETIESLSQRESLRREMLLTSAVDHPNVLRSQRFFEDEQYCAFTMEFFESGTLGDLIEKRNLFTISEIINTLEQLLEGVQAIHAAGIIHRDLKPENILIDSNGICKIADFSIAVSGLESKRDRQTNLVGTMNFLSPEYIEKGEVDQRSDLYALGVIAYELITGKLPFQHGSLIDSLMSRVRFDPQHPIRLRADCPMALAEITLRALQRDPKRRYQNAEGMLKDLEKLKNAKQQQSQSGIAMRPSTFLALISHHDPLPT